MDGISSDEAKSAVGSLRLGISLQGLSVHILSPDRGVVFYAPVILLVSLGWLFPEEG